MGSGFEGGGACGPTVGHAGTDRVDRLIALISLVSHWDGGGGDTEWAVISEGAGAG